MSVTGEGQDRDRSQSERNKEDEEGNDRTSQKKVTLEDALVKLVDRLNVQGKRSYDEVIVRPPKLKTLESLDLDELGEFITKFERTKKRSLKAGKQVDLMDWIGFKVYKKLHSLHVNMDSEAAVWKKLKEHLDMLVQSEEKSAMSRLRNNLSWKQDKSSGEEALQQYIQDAREIVGGDKIYKKSVQKQMIKVMIDKLPGYFALDYAVFKEENPDSTTELDCY